jgi:hypothetical protein
MAGKAAATGWGVAGLLALALMGKCVGNSSPPASSLAAAASTKPNVQRTVYVSAPSLNCRASGSASAVRVESLTSGASVGVVQDKGGWSLLDRPTPCWVSTRYLNTSPPPVRVREFASTESTSDTRRSSNSSGSTRRSSGSSTTRRRTPDYSYAGICPCRGHHVCIGPRGGRYCITSGGNKRYGV